MFLEFMLFERRNLETELGDRELAKKVVIKALKDTLVSRRTY